MQYPIECIVFSKHFSYICKVSIETDIFDESVLLLSLTGNLTVFKNTRITITLITCIGMFILNISNKCGVLFICIRVLSEPPVR